MTNAIEGRDRPNSPSAARSLTRMLRRRRCRIRTSIAPRRGPEDPAMMPVTVSRMPSSEGTRYASTCLRLAASSGPVRFPMINVVTAPPGTWLTRSNAAAIGIGRRPINQIRSDHSAITTTGVSGAQGFPTTGFPDKGLVLQARLGIRMLRNGQGLCGSPSKATVPLLVGVWCSADGTRLKDGRTGHV